MNHLCGLESVWDVIGTSLASFMASQKLRDVSSTRAHVCDRRELGPTLARAAGESNRPDE
jgi:hypothetical protein